MKLYHERHGLLSYDGSEIVGYCHERHKIGECPWCDFVRVEHITTEFMRRMEKCPFEVKRLYMWSLGTSLTNTRMNRKIILRRWTLFRKVMQKTEDWVPVFRIVEVGKRGFLHIHVICAAFVDHRVVLNAWRHQTREKSNVHVSGYKGHLDPRRLARYLMKYLTKESSAYRWMGPFYGLGLARSTNVCNDNVNASTVYGGLCYGGYYTDIPEVPKENYF